METRQSPWRSLNACSTCAVISRHNCASPRFCNSIVTPITRSFYPTRTAPIAVQTGQGCAGWMFQRGMNNLFTSCVENQGANRIKPHQRTRATRKIREVGGYFTALGNRKGCDIGYAPAASSCERVNSVDTCTVAALDAITAFAVPNPGSSSQSQPVFSGLVALQVAPPS